MTAVIAALRDWLELLQGPTPATFVVRADYPSDSDWKRLFRLIGTCMALTSAVAVGVLGAPGSVEPSDMKATLRVLLIAILAGAAAGVPYAFIFARLCGVRISVAKATYTFLLFTWPWIPLLAFARALGLIWPHILLVVFFLLVLFYLVAVLVPINVSRALFLVLPTCPRFRIIMSMLALVLCVALVALVGV